MTLARDDRWLADAQGRALAGADVYYCTQPADTSSIPPSPLASVYASSSGGTPVTQPLITDGFGHSVAYLDNSALYTVVFVHPLFGSNPVILPDQAVGLGGGSAANLNTFGGQLLGTIDGSNAVFTITRDGTNPLTVLPAQATIWVNFPLAPGVGYGISLIGGVAKVTFANPPQVGDTLYAQGFYQ